MEVYEREEFIECATHFSEAKTPYDVAKSWALLQGKFPELSGITHLDNYDRTVLPPCIKKYTRKPLDYITPYFVSNSLYFIDDEMIRNIFQKETNHFPIDYTVMFDTNMASYINRLVRGEPVGEVQEKLLKLVDELLRDDLNYDFLFYLVENIKTVLPKADFEAPSKLKFWLSLNRDFRDNLCSLHLFASIDSKGYKKTLNPRLTISYRQAVRNAIDSAYDFYFVKRKSIDEYMLLQRVLLLNLIGMVRIQEESNKKERNKMKVYLEFLHNTVGMYIDREAIVAHKYFISRDNLPILRKVHKGCEVKGLIRQLDNIAWDMVAPRIMEKLIYSGFGSEGQYFIPMFLSFDNALKKMLNMHPIKSAIYNRKTGYVISFPVQSSQEYFKEHNLDRDLDWICSDALKEERKLRGSHSRRSAFKAIFKEYKALIKVLDTKA
ncbi:hypothetical protein Q9887_001098 [Vibrio fluvialis]|nr:hypothetical protein [Vibrio fluvialis]MBY8138844.1 hypothetical protein [Vibrio fluvialis]